MKVIFALPAYLRGPIGGYHVHFTYANMLQARGHDVTILFPRKVFGAKTPIDHLKAPLWALKRKIIHRPLISSMRIHPRVNVRLVSDLSLANLPSADALIATAWQTAESLAGAPPRCGKKFYIVYDYEFFMTEEASTKQRMIKTYNEDFRIVATSSAVKSVVEASGGHVAAEIFCGLDFEAFGIDILPENRIPFTLGFPVRAGTYKGAADAIETAAILKQQYGEELRVTAFGTNRMALPNDILWQQYPSQTELRRFYNEQAVFLLPSHFEGWGLPAVEAMACGAALVTADNGGCRDFAFHEQTALVAPIKRPDILAKQIMRLFEDQSLRLTLAKSAHDFVQRFTWNLATDRLEALLLAAP